MVRDGAKAPPHHEGQEPPQPLRQNKKFSNPFKLICPVQSGAKKETASRKTQISRTTRAIPARKRGVSRSSRTWGRAAVDATAPGARWQSRAGFPVSDAGAPDEGDVCGRQNRVVLASSDFFSACEKRQKPPKIKHLCNLRRQRKSPLFFGQAPIGPSSAWH